MPLYNAPASSGGTLTGVDDQSSSNDDQLTIKDAEIVINEDSDDVDFRVESNGNANMLVVDASTDRVGIGTATPSTAFHAVGSALFGAITGSQGTAPRALNLVGADAVMRIARTSASNDPAIELINLSADGNTQNSYWDIYTDGDRLSFRSRRQGSTVSDINILNIDEPTSNVGIMTTSPANTFQVNHLGADANNGIMIVREDSSTADGDLLGGIGFDSTDGNVPSSVLESSAFIASIATEAHGTGDKGGNLKLGVSLIDENDDTVSTIVANVGPPDTTANATTHPGLNSRATTAIVAAATYSPTIGDSGTVIIMTNASSIVTLPDVGATDVGVQFTIINNSGGTLTGKIVSADTTNTRFNGAGSYAAQNIEDDKAKTFLCWGADNWQVIG